MDDRSSFKARIKFLSRPLLRCFRRLERWADRLTGAAGPLFLAMLVFSTVDLFCLLDSDLPLPKEHGLCFSCALAPISKWSSLARSCPEGGYDSYLEPHYPST